MTDREPVEVTNLDRYGSPPLPWSRPRDLLAASQALAGRREEARQAMEQVRRLDPAMRVSGIRSWLPFHAPEDAALFAEGLRLAGLPG